MIAAVFEEGRWEHGLGYTLPMSRTFAVTLRLGRGVQVVSAHRQARPSRNRRPNLGGQPFEIDWRANSLLGGDGTPAGSIGLPRWYPRRRYHGVGTRSRPSARMVPAGPWPTVANPAQPFAVAQEVVRRPLVAVLAQEGHFFLQHAAISTALLPGDVSSAGDSPACRYSRVPRPSLLGVRSPQGQSLQFPLWWVFFQAGQGTPVGRVPQFPQLLILAPLPGSSRCSTPVQLGRCPTGSCPRNRAQGGWRLHRAAQGAGRPPGAQHIGVVNAVSPLASADATSVIILSLVFARSRGIAQVGRHCRTSSGQASGAAPGWPEGAARHWPPSFRSSKVIWIRSGWLRGSIYWVLLFQGAMGDDHYRVGAEDGLRLYEVQNGHCECSDYLRHGAGHNCKHRLALALYQELGAEGSPAGSGSRLNGLDLGPSAD